MESKSRFVADSSRYDGSLLSSFGETIVSVGFVVVTLWRLAYRKKERSEAIFLATLFLLRSAANRLPR
jgi:hypothetical protein